MDRSVATHVRLELFRCQDHLLVLHVLVGILAVLKTRCQLAVQPVAIAQSMNLHAPYAFNLVISLTKTAAFVRHAQFRMRVHLRVEYLLYATLEHILNVGQLVSIL